MTEQSWPFASMLVLQQSSPDKPRVVFILPHPTPPHWLQPASQQTVPPLSSRPTSPLVQEVVFDVATAWLHRQTCTRMGHERGERLSAPGSVLGHDRRGAQQASSLIFVRFLLHYLGTSEPSYSGSSKRALILLTLFSRFWL